jgi:hypothetical protein
MKKTTLLILIASLLIILTLIFTIIYIKNNHNKTEQAKSLTSAIDELQNQPISENKTQTITNTNIQNTGEKIAETPKIDNFNIYRGSWFKIEYPKEFIANPVSPIDSYRDYSGKENGIKYIQTDEARFTSPDKAIEFFVFSPQWAGDPINYLTISDSEELVSEKTDESSTNLGKETTKWVTIKSKDNSYYRSYISIKTQDGATHHVFGIKYKDNATYEQYKDSYILLKNSLIQYAD